MKIDFVFQKKEELPKKSKPKYVDDEDCYPSKNVNFETDQSSHRSIAEKPKVEELSLSQRNSRRKTSDPPVSDDEEELIPSGKSYGSKPVARIVTPPIPVRRLQPDPVENFDSYSRSQALAPITQGWNTIIVNECLCHYKMNLLLELNTN